jgi:SnoaL-like domain
MKQHAGKNSVPPSVGVDVSGIETLLNRNLPEVFGEGDPARRRRAIQELYTEDCVLYVPPGTFVGHDALDKFAGDLRATHPDYVYTPHGSPQVLHNSGRWRGARGRRAKRPHTPVWISSSHGMARSRLSMFTSTRRPHDARAEPWADSLQELQPGTRRSICGLGPLAAAGSGSILARWLSAPQI